jgi:hypothetical protein
VFALHRTTHRTASQISVLRQPFLLVAQQSLAVSTQHESMYHFLPPIPRCWNCRRSG